MIPLPPYSQRTSCNQPLIEFTTRNAKTLDPNLMLFHRLKTAYCTCLGLFGKCEIVTCHAYHRHKRPNIRQSDLRCRGSPNWESREPRRTRCVLFVGQRERVGAILWFAATRCGRSQGTSHSYCKCPHHKRGRKRSKYHSSTPQKHRPHP